MNSVLVSVGTGILLFVLGVVYTITQFVKRDRAVLILIALLSPILTLVTFARLPYLLWKHKLTMDPCPAGLEDAEVEIARRRYEMFGGEYKAPSLATSWTKAYERELQRELAKVQEFAQRHLTPA